MHRFREVIEVAAPARSSRSGPGLARLLPAGLLVVLSGLLLTGPAASATDEPAPQAPPVTQPVSPEVSPPPAPSQPVLPDYAFPDLGPQALVRDGKYFWFKPIIAIVTDYTWFEQDDASLAQVGTQDDQGELRAGRLGGTLRWQGDYKWELFATVDWQEKRGAPFAPWQEGRESDLQQCREFHFRTNQSADFPASTNRQVTTEKSQAAAAMLVALEPNTATIESLRPFSSRPACWFPLDQRLPDLWLSQSGPGDESVDAAGAIARVG